ncbi:MAG: hypothetical protein HRU15_15035 [Planctomycetes bacterium]|nr:hypothetical protein [Planctomycetota bacterium]
MEAHVNGGKRAPHFVYSTFKQEVSVEGMSGSKYQVNIPKMDTVMTIDLFRKLKNADALAIAQSIHVNGDENSHSILAFYAKLNNKSTDYRNHLAKCGSLKDKVEASFVDK